MSALADYDADMVTYWLGAGGDPRWDESRLLPAALAGERLAVYRTVPAGVGDAIRPGDYVTVSRAYALHHAECNLGGWLGCATVLLVGSAHPDELEPASGPVEFFYRPRGAGRARP